MSTVYRGPLRLKVWGRIIWSLEGTLGAKKSSRRMSHPRADLKGCRPRLRPRGGRGRIDVKTLSTPRGMYLP
jgi:hypothetical protein